MSWDDDDYFRTFSTGSTHWITSDPCDVSKKRPLGFAPWPAKGETVPATEELSPREFEVMHLLDRHYSTAEVAERLYISTHTVRSHVKSALVKLGAHSRKEALRLMRDRGLLTRAAA